MYVENIIATLGMATPAELMEGSNWYHVAHELASKLSPGDVWRGAGVIAALSPRERWERNVMNATRAFVTGVATGNTFTMNAQAQAILDGTPTLDVLKGDKVRAFATAIALCGMTDTVTIDRHAYDIAMAQVGTDATRKIGKVIYRELSAAYVEAGRQAGLTGSQVQAVTWVTWRNRL